MRSGEKAYRRSTQRSTPNTLHAGLNHWHCSKHPGSRSLVSQNIRPCTSLWNHILAKRCLWVEGRWWVRFTRSRWRRLWGVREERRSATWFRCRRGGLSFAAICIEKMPTGFTSSCIWFLDYTKVPLVETLASTPNAPKIDVFLEAVGFPTTDLYRASEKYFAPGDTFHFVGSTA